MADSRKFLDYDGLKKYDVLIKQFIGSSSTDMTNALAALDAKVESLSKQTAVYYKLDSEGNYVYGDATGTVASADQTYYGYDEDTSEYVVLDPQPTAGETLDNTYVTYYVKETTTEPTEAEEEHPATDKEGNAVTITEVSTESIERNEIDELF